MADLPSANPAIDCFPVTPNDAADLTTLARGLIIGGGGALVIVTMAGNTRTLPSVSGYLPVAVRRVLATGTTATSIIAVV